MKTLTALALVALFGLLGSCTIGPIPMEITQAVQNAKTRSDHESLARYFEEAAKDLQAKSAEHKKLLTQYETNKGLYGKQASSLISHCQGLIRIYEQAAIENLRMVEAHRQMAAELK